MKILIDDGMQIAVGTGIGKYTKYLFMAINKLSSNKEYQMVQVELECFGNATGKKSLKRLKYLMHINSLNYYKRTKQYDIIHYTNYAIPFILNKHSKYVVTVHDLAAILYKETLPGFYGMYARFMLGHAIKNADAVLTVSESVKQEINKIFPAYISKVRIAYPGIYDEMNEVAINYEYDNMSLRVLPSRKFFLCIGTVEKRKNLGIVIKSFLMLKQSGQAEGFKLVLAGRPGFGYEEYEAMINISEYKSDVIITGYVSNEDCSRLYSEAAAYIFPTLYEGFGSTQLECMGHHLPLILSNIPTNIEVSKNYGMFFDLYDEQSLITQMLKIIQCDYDACKMNNVADDIIAKFEWNKLVHEYVRVYEECL